MNRASFFHRLLIAPAVAALAPLVGRKTEAVGLGRVDSVGCVRSTIPDTPTGFTRIQVNGAWWQSTDGVSWSLAPQLPPVRIGGAGPPNVTR